MEPSGDSSELKRLVLVPEVFEILDGGVRRFFRWSISADESENGRVGDDEVVRLIVAQVNGFTLQEERVIPRFCLERKVTDGCF